MENKEENRYLREEYIARINRVIDFIDRNLSDELSLQNLSLVAHFSPFHFHRIFRAIVGEPLYQFIQRIRLEKAANHLIEWPKRSITDIAFDCGFSSSSSFARAFKECFHMSATEWRRSAARQKSKIRELNRKNGKTQSNLRKDTTSSSIYYGNTVTQSTWKEEIMNRQSLNVDVKEIPEMNVAYVRHIGPYKGDTGLFAQLFTKLFNWTGARDLLHFPQTKVLAVYHDNPDVTDENKLRTSVCITVPENTQVEGEVGKMTIPGGKYAIGHFEILETEYEDAWNTLYGGWLPSSGFQPDDRPPFELYLNDPNEHPEHKHIVDIYLPVKPL